MSYLLQLPAAFARDTKENYIDAEKLKDRRKMFERAVRALRKQLYPDKNIDESAHMDMGKQAYGSLHDLLVSKQS
jgi:uncharacterized protein YecE (DUF72 family)